MTSPSAQSRPSVQSRAVAEVRIPATALRAGDLVNLSPGEDDWQEVLGVYLRPEDVDAGKSEVRALVGSLAGRYVVVELTDLAPVDNNVYFAANQALIVSTDDGPDQPVSDVASTDDGLRTYLYTKYELVTVRG